MFKARNVYREVKESHRSIRDMQLSQKARADRRAVEQASKVWRVGPGMVECL